MSCRPGFIALCAAGDKVLKLGLNREAGKEERFWRALGAGLAIAHAAHHPEDAFDKEAEGPHLPDSLGSGTVHWR